MEEGFGAVAWEEEEVDGGFWEEVVDCYGGGGVG